jgi:hypothetical protein
VTRQTAAPLGHVSLNVTNRIAGDLVGQWEAGYIDLNPPYQRGSVWTLDQRIALVRSWLMGVPIPACVLNRRDTAGWVRNNGDDKGLGPVYAVVDGKQRLETAIAWLGGKLAIPASWYPTDLVETTEDTPDGPYVRYTGLTKIGQRKTYSQMFLPCAEAAVYTIQAEAEIYLLVNGGGTPQTDADMANATRIAKEG